MSLTVASLFADIVEQGLDSHAVAYVLEDNARLFPTVAERQQVHEAIYREAYVAAFGDAAAWGHLQSLQDRRADPRFGLDERFTVRLRRDLARAAMASYSWKFREADGHGAPERGVRSRNASGIAGQVRELLLEEDREHIVDPLTRFEQRLRQEPLFERVAARAEREVQRLRRGPIVAYDFRAADGTVARREVGRSDAEQWEFAARVEQSPVDRCRIDLAAVGVPAMPAGPSACLSVVRENRRGRQVALAAGVVVRPAGVTGVARLHLPADLQARVRYLTGRGIRR